MWTLDFQIMKKYLVSILLCLSFTSLASSLEDNYNAAQAAYEKGDFNKAGDLFAKVAKELEKSDKQQSRSADRALRLQKNPTKNPLLRFFFIIAWNFAKRGFSFIKTFLIAGGYAAGYCQ